MLKETDELLQALAELATLSEKHGYTWHSEYIRETVAAFGKSPNDGWQHVTSIQFWGGAGSICDTQFSADETEWHRANNRPVPEYLRTLDADGYARDSTRQMELLSLISKLIPDDCGEDEALPNWFKRAKQTGEIFDTWLANPKNTKIMRL